MRQLLPCSVLDMSTDAIAELYAYPPDGAVRGNMVSSLDGAIAVAGRSAPISGEPDRFIFGLLRALSDVVVVGAGTARQEGYGPGRARSEFAHLRRAAGQLDAPVIAVVTRSAQLDPGSELFTAARHRTVVVTCAAAPVDRRQTLSEVADVVLAGDTEVDLDAALVELRARGLRRVLCEGGPRLLGDLAAADLLDELALSISPLVAGGDSGRIVTTAQPILQRMRLAALLEDEGFLFGRYVRVHSSDPS